MGFYYVITNVCPTPLHKHFIDHFLLIICHKMYSTLEY